MDALLDRAARDLSRADQQVVEIARALQGSAKLLILDEPTAALTEDETSRLFDVVRRMKADGIAVIYITHRMGKSARSATPSPSCATGCSSTRSTSTR
ncbi:ATP-binding cassette domain-containing protein [Leucobacter soli]|uniref:ATP-binding cassette domain-containing protein n=1 Tax=Leucobacter soli TaxID=2812850 RepID=UPI003621C9C9